jgi:pyridoxamine 5'-phosphate oxidase
MDQSRRDDEPSSTVDPALLDPIVDPRARIVYSGSVLPLTDLPRQPLPLLREWYADAVADPRVTEASAMALATVDAAGMPDVRMVLLKGLDPLGFTFFTNLGSAKAAQIAANPVASLALLWHPMYRQVRVRGVVRMLERAEAEAYFSTRPRGSQVGAWASQQSQPVTSREDVERAFAEAEARWAGVDEVPMPPFWGGYRVLPVAVEFWVGQASRLHDRLAYRTVDGAPRRLDDGAGWVSTRLQP